MSIIKGQMNPHSYSQGWAQINRKKEELKDDGTGFSLVLTIVCGLAIAVLFGTYWWEPEKQVKCHDTANHKLVSEVRLKDGTVECVYQMDVPWKRKEVLK